MNYRYGGEWDWAGELEVQDDLGHGWRWAGFQNLPAEASVESAPHVPPLISAWLWVLGGNAHSAHAPLAPPAQWLAALTCRLR